MEKINESIFIIANQIRKMISKSINNNDIIIKKTNYKLFEEDEYKSLIDCMNFTEKIEKIEKGIIIKYQNYFIKINHKMINENKFIIYLSRINE